MGTIDTPGTNAWFAKISTPFLQTTQATLRLSKCEIQSQDCVIYGIYATREAAHFKLNYLAPIFKVQEDIMDLWHTIFFSVLLLQ